MNGNLLLSKTLVILSIFGLTACQGGSSSGGASSPAASVTPSSVNPGPGATPAPAPSNPPAALPAGVEAISIDVGGRLNLRHGPSSSFDKRASMGPDEIYVAVEREGDWLRVWFDDAPGWLHAGYTKAPPASVEVRVVTSDFLNVRSGPDTSFSRIGRIYGGSMRAVIETEGSWSRIFFGGEEGWVSSSFLGDPSQAPATQDMIPDRQRSNRGFIQFPSSTPGIYSYKSVSRQWGTPRMIYGMERVGRQWERDHPNWPRMGLGDVSLENGGPMNGHASHQKGVDCDVRLLRNDSTEGYITIDDSEYSRTRTGALIKMFQDHMPIRYIFFNDLTVPGVTEWPNHRNHFHVRTLE